MSLGCPFGRSLIATAIACAVIVSGAANVFAGHLRGVTLSWIPTSNPGEVEFRFQYSGRWSALGTPPLGTPHSERIDFGDGTTGIATGPISSIDPADDWFVADLTVKHTYAGAGPFTAVYTNSARISGLKNPASMLRLETIVRPSSGNSSPTSGSPPPIVNVPLGSPSGFVVSAFDVNADALRYRLSSAAESGIPTPPPGLSIDSVTGHVTWNTSTLSAGALYAVQFTVEDLDASGNITSKIPIDLTLRVVKTTGVAPTISVTTTATYSVQLGTPMSFTVTGNDADPGDRVTLASGNLPAGASMTPSLGPALAPPVASTFQWTPGASQAGSYILTFTATDSTARRASATVTLVVEGNQPPTISCSSLVTTLYSVPATVSVATQDPNGDALTVAWKVDGVTVRTDVVPATPQSTELALTQNYGPVGTHAVSVDATDVKSLTTSCSTTVNVTKASQTIDFAPIADHNFGDSPFVLFATASSSLPPTFSVVSGPAAVTTGNVVTILGTGAVTLRASQAGNDSFNPASDVERSFTVNKAATSVTLTSSLNPSFHGQPVTFSARTAVPPNTAAPTGTMTFFDDGVAIFASHALDSNGQAAISVDTLDIREHAITAVYSGDGFFEGSASAVVVQSVPNRSPHVSLPSTLTTSEGAAVSTLTATADDPDGDPITFSWTLLSGPGELAPSGSTASYANSDGPATSVVRVIATDSHGGSAAADVTITVNNVAPTISNVTGPAAPMLSGSSATIGVTYTDPGTIDTFSCRYVWGDGTANTTVDGISGACSGSHTYAAPGVYAVSGVVTDDDTGTATEQFKYVVVYSPAAGSVTGGGWIMSPSGALTSNAGLTGRANFGFNARYQGATPVGQTEFQFQNGNLNFHSTSYAWLVVSGATAVYEGTGTINGSGPYGFLVTITDGKLAGTNVDRFRLKIWQTSTGAVVYDDQPGADDNASATTPLSGGSIVIHR